MPNHDIRKFASAGGQAVSQNRQHMSEIGRKGGLKTSQNREHMSAIGKKGGAKSRKPKSIPDREPDRDL